MINKIMFAFFASILVSTTSFAVGTTGCGLGSVIFPRNSFISQSSAASTNITGIAYSLTTGTSNCKVNGFVMGDQEKIYFMESNFRKLAEDMAKGGGENLAAFFQMFNCDSSLLPAFGGMARENFEAIFPTENTSAVEAYEALQKSLKSHPALSKSCASVG